MSRENLYTVIVTVYDRLRQWKVELHRGSSSELTGSSIFSCRLSMDGELPELLQARMVMIDMGDDMNARARATDGIGTRYTRSSDAGEGGWPGKVVQYYLHDLTEAQVKEAGLVDSGKVRGRTPRVTYTDAPFEISRSRST